VAVYLGTAEGIWVPVPSPDCVGSRRDSESGEDPCRRNAPYTLAPTRLTNPKSAPGEGRRLRADCVGLQIGATDAFELLVDDLFEGGEGLGAGEHPAVDEEGRCATDAVLLPRRQIGVNLPGVPSRLDAL